MSLKVKILILFIFSVKHQVFSWGFFAHKLINRQAVYSLPEGPLFSFFKSNIEFITENAVKPDQRRYILKEEAPRHYIDLDVYKVDTSVKLPKYYNKALQQYSAELLESHGILPWHIFNTYLSLVKAMKENNQEKVLKTASEIGHYIGDAHVPLHTTHNYDGQMTNQKGIHGLWESRVPELYSENFDYLTGTPVYIKDVQEAAWKMVNTSHAAVDSVFYYEKSISSSISDEHKYSFEERNGVSVRTYSPYFTRKYADALDGQVERRLRSAIKALADIWYTAWIDAGQPVLGKSKVQITEEQPGSDKIIENSRFLESHNCEFHRHDHQQKLLVKE